ncbi:hypothetical protein GIB67_017426 [Kingdonia uniflora]|uniref:BZIP domain-containing protein n=1 Tax=Kingdonia uniflora TaxID=39325 RepID=A0A7J7M495_9MAGN|nr:hypothetical protein GIB67_017426 [Kingdonia uniflora]
MSSQEESTTAKSSKQVTSTQETPTTPVYPDWSTSMQAYYGAGGTPPTFFPSTVPSSPSPHPYLWPSQHFMQPYGTPLPYPAIYTHGGLYTHPNIAAGAAPVPTETEGKGSEGKNRVSKKKSKGSSGTGVVGGKSGEGGKIASSSGNDGASQSAESGSDGSSDSSDENNNQQEALKKRTFDQMLADGKDFMCANARSDNTAQYNNVNVPVSVPGMPATNLNIGMELWNQSSVGSIPMKARQNTANVSLPVLPSAMGDGAVPGHPWVQDERELKKQKRKQSNRESARRSRLRKQAECEELQVKVEKLTNENGRIALEMQRLAQECEKLKNENASMKEQLNQSCEPSMLLLQDVESNGHEQESEREINSVSNENGNLFNSNDNLESDPN